MNTISIKIKESDSTAFIVQILRAMQEKGLIEMEGELPEASGWFSVEGNPISMQQLIFAVEEAQEAFERGEHYTTAQLREIARKRTA